MVTPDGVGSIKGRGINVFPPECASSGLIFQRVNITSIIILFGHPVIRLLHSAGFNHKWSGPTGNE